MNSASPVATRRLLMGCRWTISGRHIARRLLGLIALLPFVVGSLPLPMDSGSRPKKDLSQPFPCQNRPCGCRSAQHCWQKCCCFTNAQKVAWARRHRVALPDEVLAAARREAIQPDPTAKSCCSKASSSLASTGCDSGRGTRPAPSPAGKRVVKDQSSAAASSTQAASKVVIGVMAAQCQGQDWSWLVVPAGILPTARIPQPPAVPNVRACVPASDAAPALAHQPPVPPPRPARALSDLV